MELGATTSQALGPRDLTLSNTHDVLPNACGPESCQRESGLALTVCTIFAMENSVVLPYFSLDASQ